MKVTFERTVGPEYMMPVMNVTDGKTKGKKKFPRLDTYGKMILSEHSPSRIVRYLIKIENIPYYAHVHLIRHNVGVQFYVLSQRDDGGFQEVTPRDDIPQGAMITMYLDANVQGLLNIAKFRSCYKAHRIVQSFINKLKIALYESENSDEYDHMLGKLLLKRCEWNGGYCQEPKPCGRVPGVKIATDVHAHIFQGVK